MSAERESEIDRRALLAFECGMYIVGTAAEGRLNGQLANTVFQVTSEPPQIAVALSKTNMTHNMIRKSRIFSVSILAETAPFAFLGKFGFRSGRDIDKFEKTAHKIGVTGCPLVTEHTVAAVETKVKSEIDVGTHTIFIGEMVASEILDEGKPMSYAFYRENLKGKTPPASPTYQPS